MQFPQRGRVESLGVGNSYPPAVPWKAQLYLLGLYSPLHKTWRNHLRPHVWAVTWEKKDIIILTERLNISSRPHNKTCL